MARGRRRHSGRTIERRGGSAGRPRDHRREPPFERCPPHRQVSSPQATRATNRRLPIGTLAADGACSVTWATFDLCDNRAAEVTFPPFLRVSGVSVRWPAFSLVLA